MMKRVILLYVVGLFMNNYYIFGYPSSDKENYNRRFNWSIGFSILELLVAVSMIAVAGAVLLPNLVDWRSNMRLKAAANELKENLELAKTLAAKNNKHIVVEFVPLNGNYQIGFVNSKGDLLPLKAESLPPEVKIDNSHPKYSAKNDKTGFNSRGGADNCTIVLTNLKKKSKLISISVIGKIVIKNQ